MSIRGYTPPTRIQAIAAASARTVDFASREIDIANPDQRLYLRRTVANSRAKAEQAWKWYERIGEVHYGLSRSAKIAGYAKLKGVRVDGTGTEQKDAGDRSVITGIVSNIYSPYGGVRHLIERFYLLMKLPGDAYLARNRTAGGVHDGYLLLSSDEIDQETLDTARRNAGGPIRWRSMKVGTQGDTNEIWNTIAPEDFLGRIWTPSARFVDETDSPMIALDTECDVLDKLTQTMKGRILSRFAMAGILLIPSEMNDAVIAGDQTVVALHTDKVLNYLMNAMTRNVMAHDNALTYVPIMLKGPAEVLDKAKHLILETALAESDLKFRAELIGRILTGLDVQRNATEGIGDSNHWGAWAVSDEERRVSVMPDLEAMCWALTRLILWRELKAQNWSDSRIAPWRVAADLSEAAVKSNVGEDFRQAYDRGGISHVALRRASGAHETDAPDNMEYVRWVGAKTGNPYLATYGLEGTEDIDWQIVAGFGSITGPDPKSPADDSESGPGKDSGSPDSNDSDTPRSERPA